MSQVTQWTQQLIQQARLSREETYAVVGAHDWQALVPQADEYRFLLRVKGYQVTHAQNNEAATKLLMFIEEPGFDWKNWSCWDVESFGAKEWEKTETYKNISLVMWKRK